MKYLVSGEDRYDGEIEVEFENIQEAFKLAITIREDGGWADVLDESSDEIL